MNPSPASLVVSVLPRGTRSGAAGLIALDLATLHVQAVRLFGVGEYLADPVPTPHPLIEHCRGVVQRNGILFTALFNAVGAYVVRDASSLTIDPVTRLTAPAAVDLHGLEVRDDVVVAASTGADAVIRWQLGQSVPQVIALSTRSDVRDWRFPRRLAAEANCGDWREVLDVSSHINHVAVRAEGGLLVGSLTRIVVVTDAHERPLVTDRGAQMHDAQETSDGDVIATDAARGTVVTWDGATGKRVQDLAVADPERWFVRGLLRVGENLMVLRSERVATRQRCTAAFPRAVAPTGCRFGVTVLDARNGVHLLERDIEVPEVARGSVVYAVDRLRRTVRAERTAALQWAARLSDRETLAEEARAA